MPNGPLRRRLARCIAQFQRSGSHTAHLSVIVKLCNTTQLYVLPFVSATGGDVHAGWGDGHAGVDIKHMQLSAVLELRPVIDNVYHVGARGLGYEWMCEERNCACVTKINPKTTCRKCHAAHIQPDHLISYSSLALTSQRTRFISLD